MSDPATLPDPVIRPPYAFCARCRRTALPTGERCAWCDPDDGSPTQPEPGPPVEGRRLIVATLATGASIYDDVKALIRMARDADRPGGFATEAKHLIDLLANPSHTCGEGHALDPYGNCQTCDPDRRVALPIARFYEGGARLFVD